MKQGLLFLSVVTFILFTSCEKEKEPTLLIDLAIDLQNGYWEKDFGTAINVLKFNTSTVTSYWIEGTPPCIDDTFTQGYTLDGNVLTLLETGDGGTVTIEIQGNTLSFEPEDWQPIIFERKETLDYPDC